MGEVTLQEERGKKGVTNATFSTGSACREKRKFLTLVSQMKGGEKKREGEGLSWGCCSKGKRKKKEGKRKKMHKPYIIK